MNPGNKKLKVLVTGANGQLGKDLLNILSINTEVVGMDRTKMDITDLHQVSRTIYDLKPDIVIHTAAYTNVDHSEMNQELAVK